MPSVFGDFVDGADVEVALLEHLKLWMPTYVEEVRRQKDPLEDTWRSVAPIRSFTVVHQADQKWPEDQLPMLLAYAPGLAAEPDAEGAGPMGAIYECALTAIASGSGMADSKALARLYATAAKGAILQHESLGGFALGTRWTNEKNYPLTGFADRERSLMAVSAVYQIEVEAVLDRHAGIAEPEVDPESPADPLPEITSTDVEVTIEPH